MFFSLSFTHKNTALLVRERLALSEAKKAELLRLIAANAKVEECVLLSTCNRTEILCALYAADDGAAGVREYLLKCICLVCEVPLELVQNCPDCFEESGFIHHLFTVASSLDSIVIGETQIVHQLKTALAFSAQNASVPRLEAAIAAALKCAALVRNETQISRHRLSISSVAVAHAKERGLCGNGDAAATAAEEGEAEEGEKRGGILIIGSGEMARLCAKALNERVLIASRNIEHARELAAELNGATPPGGQMAVTGKKSSESSAVATADENSTATTAATIAAAPVAAAISLEQALSRVSEFSLIFTATSAPGAILHASHFAPGARCVIYDLAVPRDTDFASQDGLQVVCVDDLQGIVAANLALKEEQAKIAYQIIARKVREFFAREKELAALPIIKAMRARARQISELELAKARKKGYLRGCDEQRVSRFCEQLFASYLHEPTVRLKSADGYELDVLHYLFD